MEVLLKKGRVVKRFGEEFELVQIIGTDHKMK